MAQFDTMTAAEPYLYFRGTADEDLCVQAGKLTSIHATSGTNIRLTFTNSAATNAGEVRVTILYQQNINLA